MRLAAFVVRRFDGVLHVLVNARAEPGFSDTVELGPTVQCSPDYCEELPEDDRPPFYDLVRSAPVRRVRYDVMHSEEGGRFLNASTRYLVVEGDETSAPLRPPAGYCWVTPAQLSALLRHNHYLNVEARTLLAAFKLQALTA
jgi:oxidase EvaA